MNKHGNKHGKSKTSKDQNKEEHSLVKKASSLFQRVPVLKALFFEILSGQGLATLLNVCFVKKLSETLPDDSQRAGWMGKVSIRNAYFYFSCCSTNLIIKAP